MHIGLDLDDTIINHTPHRETLASENGIVDKKILYGELSLSAPPYKDARETIDELAKTHSLSIISRRKADSRPLAKAWIAQNLPDFPLENVFFVDSDEEKARVCGQQQINLFMDDSPLVLTHLKTRYKYLYSPQHTRAEHGFSQIRSWHEFKKTVQAITA